MPPKTEQEIREFVTKFYKELEQAVILEKKITGEDGDRVIIKISDEDIEKAIASYTASQEDLDRARKYMEQEGRKQQILDELMKESSIKPEVKFGRTAFDAMDLSGTQDAKIKNLETYKRISTKEGYKQYVRSQIDLALKMDPTIIANYNVVNGADLILNPDTAAPLKAAFIVTDYIDAAKAMGIELTEEELLTLKINQDIAGSFLPAVMGTQKALTNPRFFCINTEIPIVKDLMTAKYSLINDNDACELIIDSAPYTNKKTFGEQHPAIGLIGTFRDNKFKLNSDVLSDLNSGFVTSFKTESGENMLGIVTPDGLVRWERNLPSPEFNATDGYTKAIETENAIYTAFLKDAESEDIEDKYTEPFKKVLDASKELHDFYQKNGLPQSPENIRKIAELIMHLEDAAKAYRKTTTPDTAQNYATKIQAEYAATVLDFIKNEKNCMSEYSKNLPFNQFGNKLNELLSDPQYDFNTASPTDSLRIQTFLFYKEAGSTELLEQSDFLLTRKPTGNMTTSEYDKIIRNDAYELIQSQDPLQSKLYAHNYDIYRAAKSCSAVIYPRSGDINKARLLYIDKNGNPRLSGELGSMPQLGDTLAQIDRLKALGDPKWQNFPSKMTIGFKVTQEEKEAMKENTRIRSELAKPLYAENCKAFFPDAENPELLVSNAINYSAARQGFMLSSFGEVLLTEEQKKDPKIVKEAKLMQEDAIKNVLIQRQFEAEVMIDSGRHPEYYKKKELAAERNAYLKAVSELKYNSDAPHADKLRAMIDKHHPEMTQTLEDFLKEKELDFNGLDVYDSNINGIAAGEKEKPWDKIEGAAALLDAEKPIYLYQKNGNKLMQVSLAEGELVLENKAVEFTQPEDEILRREDFNHIKHIWETLEATGTTRRDSPEYRRLAAAAKEAYELAKKCNTNQPSAEALIARDKMAAAKQKLADCADAYFVAKVDQSMNSRRSRRFAVTMMARHIADNNYEEAVRQPANLIKEAIAAKIIKVQNDTSDRVWIKEQIAQLRSDNSFKAFTSDAAQLDKLFVNDGSKLIRKFNEKSAQLEQQARQQNVPVK